MATPGEHNLGTLYYKIRLDTSELRRELADVRGMVGQLGGGVARPGGPGGLPTAPPGPATAANLVRAPLAANASRMIGASRGFGPYRGLTSSVFVPIDVAPAGITATSTFTAHYGRMMAVRQYEAGLGGAASTAAEASEAALRQRERVQQLAERAWERYRRLSEQGKPAAEAKRRALFLMQQASSFGAVSERFGTRAVNIERRMAEASEREARRMAGAARREFAGRAIGTRAPIGLTPDAERAIARATGFTGTTSEDDADRLVNAIFSSDARRQAKIDESRRLAAARDALRRGAAPWVARVGAREGMSREAAERHVERMVFNKAAALQSGGMSRADAITAATEQVVAALVKSARRIDAAGTSAARARRQAVDRAAQIAEYDVQEMGPFRQYLAYRNMARSAGDPVRAARYRSLASRAWRSSNVGRFLGPPSGMGIYFSAVFGGWELAQAQQAMMQEALEVGSAQTPEAMLSAMASGIESASSGPLGSVSKLAWYAFNGQGPLAVTNFLRRAAAQQRSRTELERGAIELAGIRRSVSLVGVGGMAGQIAQARAAAKTQAAYRNVDIQNLVSTISGQNAYIGGLASEYAAYSRSTWLNLIPGRGFYANYLANSTYDMLLSATEGRRANVAKLRQLRQIDTASTELANAEIRRMEQKRAAMISSTHQAAAEVRYGSTFAGQRAASLRQYGLESMDDRDEARAAHALRMAQIAEDERLYMAGGSISLGAAFGAARAGGLRVRGYAGQAAIVEAQASARSGLASAWLQSRASNPLFDPNVQASIVSGRAAIRDATDAAMRGSRLFRFEVGSAMASSRLRMADRPFDAVMNDIASSATAAMMQNPEQALAIAMSAIQQRAELQWQRRRAMRDVSYDIETWQRLASARLSSAGDLALSAIAIGRRGYEEARALREQQMPIQAMQSAALTIQELRALKQTYYDTVRPAVTGANTYFDQSTAGGSRGLEQIEAQVREIKQLAAEIAAALAGLKVVN